MCPFEPVDPSDLIGGGDITVVKGFLMKRRYFRDFLCDFYESLYYFISVKTEVILPQAAGDYLDIDDDFTLRVTCTNTAPSLGDFLLDAPHVYPYAGGYFDSKNWLAFTSIDIYINRTSYAVPLDNGNEVHGRSFVINRLERGEIKSIDVPMRAKLASTSSNEEILAYVYFTAKLDYEKLFTLFKYRTAKYDVRPP